MTTSQSLARGDLGHGLRLAARSHTDPSALPALRDLIRSLGPVVVGPDCGPFYGAPAIAFVLHTAVGGFERPLSQLDDIVAQITTDRLQATHHRIEASDPAEFAEYDLLRGLAGFAVFWLHRGTRPEILTDVLRYLVTLVQPDAAQRQRPGWWVWHRRDDPTAVGGHANNGMAHGVAGPLAVLSLARIAGHQVSGHDEAITGVLDHLDRARRVREGKVWWDRWDGEARDRPPQPSWCYGTPGIARAQQLAGLALVDRTRQADAEHTLTRCLADPDQTRLLVQPGVCHGIAGTVQVAERAAADAITPEPLRQQATYLRTRLAKLQLSQEPRGVLDGGPGVQLVTDDPPTVPWDACLGLI